MIAGGPVSTVTWAYDEVRAGFFNIGQVTTTTDPSGSATYNHDAAGNAVAWQRTIDGTVYDFMSAFDLGGRPLWTQYPDGDLVGSADSPLRYDGAGRPIAIPGLVTGASYDAAGRLVSLANANGTTTTAQYSATRSWINSMQTTLGSSGTAVDSLDYSNRDAEGKLMGVSSSVTGDTFSYRYDDAHRLVSATITSSAATETQTLTYDPIGNILSNSRVGAYTYARTGGAGPHAVTLAGSQAYSYDATGNMIAGGGRTLTYDFTGMPTSINGIAFFYDADNARIKKVNGSTTTHYLAGDSVEVNASKTPRRSGCTSTRRVRFALSPTRAARSYSAKSTGPTGSSCSRQRLTRSLAATPGSAKTKLASSTCTPVTTTRCSLGSSRPTRRSRPSQPWA
jgi:YD repeat-containing protein